MSPTLINHQSRIINPFFLSGILMTILCSVPATHSCLGGGSRSNEKNFVADQGPSPIPVLLPIKLLHPIPVRVNIPPARPDGSRPAIPEMIFSSPNQPPAPVPPRIPEPTPAEAKAAADAEAEDEAQDIAYSNFKSMLINQHLWNAAIVSKDSNGSSFVCGGFRTETGAVITSASCFNKDTIPSQLMVAFANNGVKFHNVKSVVPHPHFRDGSYYNDVAVLTLEQPVYWSDFSQDASVNSNRIPDVRHAVNLYARSESLSEAMVTDWDIVSQGAPSRKKNATTGTKPIGYMLPVVKRTKILLNNGVCENIYRQYCSTRAISFDALFPKGIDSTLRCSIVNGGTTCGDNKGYQLVSVTKVPSSNNGFSSMEYVLLGTVARGSVLTPGVPECNGVHQDYHNLPSIYTNLPSYADWIYSEIV